MKITKYKYIQILGITKIVAIFLLLIFTIQSCKKYEDGPRLSLLTRKQRLRNTWVVDKYIENGIDRTQDFKDSVQSYTESYKLGGVQGIVEASGTFEFSFVSDGIAHTNSSTDRWSLDSEDKALLYVDSEGFDPNCNCYSSGTIVDNVPCFYSSHKTILRLKNKELWYTYNKGDKQIEMHFIPKK
jgi:hypothetical protein